jgi:FKBP-type peptidyl-prolyl cis-trans isomerase
MLCPLQEVPLKITAILLIAFIVVGAAMAEDAETPKKVFTTASGIKYEIVTPGKEGTSPAPGDTVTVHYTGRFTDGRKFDSSLDRGRPFEFVLGFGNVIKGWDEGVALMTVGSEFVFTIPWKLAYGEKGNRGIPPKADLVFDVELLGVKKATVPMPKFQEGDPENQKKTESGIVYEVLKEGEGTPPLPDQSVKMIFALWTTAGEHIHSTASSGQYAGGKVSSLTLGPRPLKFLQELLLITKPGARLRIEAPPALCWGEIQIHPLLPPNSVTVWEITLLKINEVPEFRLPDPEKAKTTASGLVYEVIEEGSGKTPGPTSMVEVHYTGWLTTGDQFDSSHARGEPISFPLNGVIPGWTEGLQLMKEGGTVLFSIPWKIAYGASGRPPAIPAKADLIFLVELIKVK